MLLNKKNLGNWGENKACDYLCQQGYLILQRNYYAGGWGEIDIIAAAGEELVFVEVKTKRNQFFGIPEDELNDFKKQKLARAISYYLETNCFQDRDWRLDLIVLEKMGSSFQLRHYKYVC
jgi:putative endonuclease